MMGDHVSIANALTRATDVIEDILDAALARVVGGETQPLSVDTQHLIRELTSEKSLPLDAEMSASAKAAGVERREMTSLRDAPALPQSLILNQDQGGVAARAKALPLTPLWQLAGVMACSSARAVARADRYDAWIRATFLLLNGRAPAEPNCTRALWTLIHSEAQQMGCSPGLIDIAADLAHAAPACRFQEAFLCCEHALRCGQQALGDQTGQPLSDLPLAGAPRYGFINARPGANDVPDDFAHHIFNSKAYG